MSQYVIKVGKEIRGTISADFAQASCTIFLDGVSTPFQVADARHDPDSAAGLIVDWADSQDGSIVADGEEYSVERGD
jgi:hypothetical protein